MINVAITNEVNLIALLHTYLITIMHDGLKVIRVGVGRVGTLFIVALLCGLDVVPVDCDMIIAIFS